MLLVVMLAHAEDAEPTGSPALEEAVAHYEAKKPLTASAELTEILATAPSSKARYYLPWSCARGCSGTIGWPVCRPTWRSSIAR
jgi:hypothetical protein